MEVDYLVVGSGLTGGTIARCLADRGERVLIVDRRPHVGGNVHDHKHASGIRIHTYGPHYFRTSSDRIWAFVNRFDRFYRYEPVLMTQVDGALEYWPIQGEYIDRTVGADWTPSFTGTPENFEEASLAIMPQPIYEKFIRGYNVKQWGIDPRALETGLAGRFDVRTDGEKRLKTSPHQGIPVSGYAGLMSNLVAGIPTLTGVDYRLVRNAFTVRKRTIYTGPIDELFDYDLGKLAYRGQKREHSYFPDADYRQPVGQVNTPGLDQGPQVRILEWKHMMAEDERARAVGTVLTTETPFTPTDPNEYEYPFPDSRNRELFKRYQSRLAGMSDLLVCGRLGEYRYYDMDQAIGRALMLVERVLLPGATGAETVALMAA
ncbi:FAD-dependent oxidoreductase [Methylobacterium sp. ID0610]|uniref:FAD-dependent oxidoreductase n=1 Tax=Methylobacterium carpenticola TaxID=3344827 RepID=UPI00368C8F24